MSIEAINDAHAVETTAILIIDYLEENDGKWPRGWDDLRDNPDFFATLPEEVEVDWQADPDELLKATSTAGHPPIRAVWLKNGSGVYFEDAEPNRMILEYLQDRAGD